jgi:pyruvate,orthophosphate dikinase
MKAKGSTSRPRSWCRWSEPYVNSTPRPRSSADGSDAVFAERGEKIDYMLGTMIETPRAALIADSIGQQAEFFSFGTNDLTQMTMGFSRDDAGKFLPSYLKDGMYERDPFQSIDQKGVGLLVKMAVEKGRAGAPGHQAGRLW